MIVIGILLWIASLFINPIVAKRKNRDTMKWCLGAFFAGPLTTLILLALPHLGKICPLCAETVNPEAKVCRYCKYDFSKIVF